MQYKVGKYQSNQGFKTIIKPSSSAVKSHLTQIKSTIEKYKRKPKISLIKKLNPIFRGWCNYYSSQCSKTTFNKIRNVVFQMLRGWAVSRHKKGTSFSVEWSDGRYGKWTFQTTKGETLYNHAETPIVRHTKVKGDKSPYDGDWVYWSSRRGKYTGIKNQVAKLLKRQKGKCSHCGLYFEPDALIEVHHIDRNRSNNKTSNLTLMHRHCHDIIHAKGTHDKAPNH